jgi:plastocyanin
MRIAAFAAGLTLIAWAMGLAAGEQPRSKTHTVIMEDMRFQPEVLTVAPGDTIVWVNKDLVPHTATSEAGGFDSKDIEAGDSWRFTVSAKGDFAYVCTRHPAMTAMLHVQ